jgi:hypothetical protein
VCGVRIVKLAVKCAASNLVGCKVAVL